MKRVLWTMIAAVLATVALAACGGGGTHTQSLSPTPSTSDSTTATHTSAPPATPTWTPPAYGQAQPAVDAYLAYSAAENAGLANPAKFDPATAAKYAAGEARDVMVQSIADEKRQGRAWRGTPWSPRIIVVSTNFKSAAPEVVLSNCPAPNSSWTEYVVATGKPVPSGPTPKPPLPYASTIKVLQVPGGKWVVMTFTLDGSKTCTR